MVAEEGDEMEDWLYDMKGFIKFLILYVLPIGAIITLIAFLILLLFCLIVGDKNKKQIVLDVNTFECKKFNTYTTSQTMIVGKSIIVQPMQHTECVLWGKK